ncbi:MAG: hypoxanthine phosphoribosyltransferase [Candidatus Enteromonas sp.]|jgi:hypoxanthine phosphoribosyltransferase|nr:hypoxanthine phosphoribosyltransferase [Bacilli bacterium]MEE3298847.1 hypoxanthine phosphoribosyltransferase [Candidatus Enteromonas sp.]MBQ2053236.1 hypoxanthine phosphoribosyltransferase [Bacilli bacterium]MBQ4182321.1 hypoxanthine phosphoribosyltransferase [Bacilli bacterium]MEE3426584.1 hypoxanthine phosphoribosyltransferase [Candidatus Enteromonas sp.]
MSEVVMSQELCEATYKKVGQELTELLKNEEKRPILLCVMKGAMNFLIGMMKYVECPVIVDYIHISSYDGTDSTGKINLLKDMTFNPEGRTVVIVEDVIDTGLSLAYLKDYLNKKYHPKDVKIAVFVDKTARRKVDVKVDVVGFTMNVDKYIVGNGFDYHDMFRNVPYVFTPSEEDFKKWDEMIAKDPLEKNE